MMIDGIVDAPRNGMISDECLVRIGETHPMYVPSSLVVLGVFAI